MAEKRKPTIRLVVKFPGKAGKPRRARVELFPERLWQGSRAAREKAGWRFGNGGRYRVRVNGKFHGWELFTVSEVFAQLRSLVLFNRVRVGAKKSGQE